MKAKYLTDPALWATEVLGEELAPWQVAALDNLPYLRVTVAHAPKGQAANGLAAIVTAWWTALKEGQDALTVVMARDINECFRTFGTLKRYVHEGTLTGKVTEQRVLRGADGGLVAHGMSAQSNTNGLSGYHYRDGILGVYSGPADTRSSNLAGMEAITTGPNDRLLVIRRDTE